MICQFIFGDIFTLFILLVSTIFFIYRNQLIRIIFIIVNLCCFKTHFINTNFGCQFFYFFHLVFIWFYYQKLEKYKWRFAFKFFLPFYNILCTLYHLIKIASNPVLLIYFLCGSINRNNKPV